MFKLKKKPGEKVVVLQNKFGIDLTQKQFGECSIKKCFIVEKFIL